MKTIKQIADEIGISKQAVSKRIDVLGCRSELELVGGQYQINDELERKIKEYLSPTNQSVGDKTQKVGCHQPTANHQPTIRLVDAINAQIADKDRQIKEQREQIESLMAQIETKNAEISELKIISALYEKLKEEVESLKADKTDLQKHRDNLTAALTVSKSDLARLENIITQMAALPLRTRVFGWSGAVAQLTTSTEEISQVVVDSMIDEDANG